MVVTGKPDWAGCLVSFAIAEALGRCLMVCVLCQCEEVGAHLRVPQSGLV